MSTFLISGDNGGDLAVLKEKLAACGIAPFNMPPRVIDGVLARVSDKLTIPRVGVLVMFHDLNSSGYDHNTYSVECDVQNRHTVESIYPICRKDLLHANPEMVGFVARTWPLADFKFSGAPVIMRPSHMLAAGGKDIIVVSNADEYAAAVAYYTEKQTAHDKIINKSMKYYQVIASEYVTKPMLFNGRKMHLRLFAISTTEYLSGGAPIFDFAPVGEILLARDQYVEADWQNKDIHDTHFGSTGADYTFPWAFPRQDILPQFYEWLKNLAAAIKKFLHPQSYPQARNSYNIYGLDIMFWEDGTPVLIEINDRPGQSSYGTNPKFYDALYTWETSHVERLLRGNKVTASAFLISGISGADLTVFARVLTAHGIAPLEQPPHVRGGILDRTDTKLTFAPISVLIMYGYGDDAISFDRNTFAIDCKVQSTHTADSMLTIARKDMLHAALHGSEFIAPTAYMEDYKFSNQTVIMRPSHMLACSGNDVIVADNAEKYNDAVAFYSEKIAAWAKLFHKRLKYYRVIVSEYITRPMLLEGRKMHLRAYAISTTEYLTDGGAPLFEFAPVGLLTLAREQYRAEDWQNKDIHDTHFKSTGGDFIFPEAFPRADILPRFYEWQARLCAAISKFLRVESFPQTKFSYNIYGLDIMFWEDGTPVLIEINDRPGEKTYTNHASFYERLFEWETAHITRMLAK